MPRKILLEKVEFKKKKKYGEEFTVMNKSFKERNFRFRNFSFINCVCILIFSCFVLQLVVCQSQNTYPNFSIFQIGLFRYQRLILDWMPTRISKGADLIKRFTFFFLCCLYLYCLISCKNVFDMTIVNW